MNFKSEEHFHAVKAAGIKKFKEMFPTVGNSSGIYVFWREQQVGETLIKYGYVGQAKHLTERIVSHLISVKGHIDRSIIKRGVKWKNNGEWSFFVEINCKKEELDQKERDTIEKYMSMGWQLPYNKTLGGQSDKVGVADGERKGYLAGKKDGYSKAIADFKQYFCLEALPTAFRRDGKLRADAQRLLSNFESRSIQKEKTTKGEN